MRSRFARLDWWTFPVVMGAFASVSILGSTLIMSGVTFMPEHRGLLLSLCRHVGGLALGLAACVVPLRTLGVVMASAGAALFAGLAVSGGLGDYLTLPLSALVGALDVCVWTLLVRMLHQVRPALGNPLVLLTFVVAALANLLTFGLLHAPSALQGISFGLSVLLAVAFLAGRSGETPSSSRKPGGWPTVLALFALALPLKVATFALTHSRLYPLASVGSRLWIENSAAFVGQGSLLAAALWLGHRRQAARTVHLAAWSILAGAALVPCFLVGEGPFTWLASFGKGLVASATPLLLVVAALLTPHKLLPLMLAGWFASNFFIARVADLVADWARNETVRQIPLVVGACVLMVGSAAALLFTLTDAEQRADGD